MKKSLFFLFAIMFLIAGCSQKQKDFVYRGQLYNSFGFLSQEKLYGKVREMVQKNWWAVESNGKVEKGSPYTKADRAKITMTRDFIEEYNESGAMIGYTSYEDSGKVFMDIKATANGKTVEKSDYFLADTLSYYCKYVYEGDKLASVQGYFPGNDTLMGTIKISYDPNNYIIKSDFIDKKGEPGGSSVYERDPAGNILKVINYNKDGKQTSLYEYTYNKKGERTKAHEEYASTKRIVDRTYEYSYDDHGNWTSTVIIQDGKPWVIRTREFKYY